MAYWRKTFVRAWREATEDVGLSTTGRVIGFLLVQALIAVGILLFAPQTLQIRLVFAIAQFLALPLLILIRWFRLPPILTKENEDLKRRAAILDLPFKISVTCPKGVDTYVNISMRNDTGAEITGCGGRLAALSKKVNGRFEAIGIESEVPVTWAPDWFVPIKDWRIGAPEALGVAILRAEPLGLRCAADYDDGFSDEMKDAGEYKFNITLSAKDMHPQHFVVIVAWDGSTRLTGGSVTVRDVSSINKVIETAKRPEQ